MTTSIQTENCNQVDFNYKLQGSQQSTRAEECNMAEKFAANKPENHRCRCLNINKHNEILALENVQKEVCFEDLFWSCDYVTLLDLLSMPSLSNRRETLRLCLLFNIITGRLVHPSCPIVFKRTPYANRNKTLSNLWSLKPIATSSKTCSCHECSPLDKNGMNSIHYFKHTYSIIILILLFCLLPTYIKVLA